MLTQNAKLSLKWMLVIVLVLGVSDSGRVRSTDKQCKADEFLDPLINRCAPCPNCQVGWGLADNCGFGQGAGLECERCMDGFFNAAPGSNKCLPCKDCSVYNRVTMYKCRHVINTECGHCIDDYYESFADQRDSSHVLYPCSHCSDQPEHAQCTGYKQHMTSSVALSLSELPDAPTTDATLQSHSANTSLFVTLLGVFLLLLLGVIIFAIAHAFVTSRRQQRRDKRARNRDIVEAVEMQELMDNERRANDPGGEAPALQEVVVHQAQDDVRNQVFERVVEQQQQRSNQAIIAAFPGTSNNPRSVDINHNTVESKILSSKDIRKLLKSKRPPPVQRSLSDPGTSNLINPGSHKVCKIQVPSIPGKKVAKCHVSKTASAITSERRSPNVTDEGTPGTSDTSRLCGPDMISNPGNQCGMAVSIAQKIYDSVLADCSTTRKVNNEKSEQEDEGDTSLATALLRIPKPVLQHREYMVGAVPKVVNNSVGPLSITALKDAIQSAMNLTPEKRMTHSATVPEHLIEYTPCSSYTDAQSDTQSSMSTQISDASTAILSGRIPETDAEPIPNPPPRNTDVIHRNVPARSVDDNENPQAYATPERGRNRSGTRSDTRPDVQFDDVIGGISQGSTSTASSVDNSPKIHITINCNHHGGNCGHNSSPGNSQVPSINFNPTFTNTQHINSGRDSPIIIENQVNNQSTNRDESEKKKPENPPPEMKSGAPLRNTMNSFGGLPSEHELPSDDTEPKTPDMGIFGSLFEENRHIQQSALGNYAGNRGNRFPHGSFGYPTCRVQSHNGASGHFPVQETIYPI